MGQALQIEPRRLYVVGYPARVSWVKAKVEEGWGRPLVLRLLR